MNFALTIGSDPPKGIPYPAQHHSDGTNHGFKQLKGVDIDVASIAEAAHDPSLLDLLREINRIRSPLFSVGCDNPLMKAIDSGFTAQGYVEVCYNTIEQAKDPASYFRIFMGFAERAKNIEAPRLSFLFQIERAHFLEYSMLGFTLQIWITIPPVPTRENATKLWESGLIVLKDFFAGLPEEKGGTPIFAIS